MYPITELAPRNKKKSGLGLESQKAIVEHFADKDKATIIKGTSKQKAEKKSLIDQNYSKLLIFV